MMNETFSTDKNKSNYEFDVNNHWLEFGYDEVYKASIFIPLINNALAAQNAGGVKVKTADARALEHSY